MKIHDLRILIRGCLLEENTSTTSLVSEMTVTPIEDFVKSSLTEAPVDGASDFLGASARPASDSEMADYLQVTRDKEKTPAQKFSMPYIHPTNAEAGGIEIRNEDDKKINLDALRRMIMTRPAKMLQQNEKLASSGGVEGFTQYHNIGLPALTGLAVDEKTGGFVIVNTCPGAGACKVYCYARKGGYVQYKDSSMNQTRTLNFLLNDPEGFANRLVSDIHNLPSQGPKGSIKHVIRWHDAGDFFSPDYLKLAYSVARRCPNVDFYAYTKIAGVALGEKPDNFVINFSMGAKKEQETQINFAKSKSSMVIPKDLFIDLLKFEPSTSGKPKYVRDEKGRAMFKSDADLDTLKDRLSKKFNVSKDSVLTYDEMRAIPESGEIGKYNVIVRPKDGDDSASRKDVLGTYLLIH